MKYCKKPVVIDAWQYDGDLKNSDGEFYCPPWVEKAFNEGTLYYSALGESPSELFVKTLEGDHHASVGDYIIQGVAGELYPVSYTHLRAHETSGRGTVSMQAGYLCPDV